MHKHPFRRLSLSSNSSLVFDRNDLHMNLNTFLRDCDLNLPLYIFNFILFC